MNHKLINESAIFILFLTTILYSPFNTAMLSHLVDDDEQTIIQGLPSLRTNDSTIFIFENASGKYESINGVISLVESYVDPEWLISYKKSYQDYIERIEREQKQSELLEKYALIIQHLSIPFIFWSLFTDPIDFNLINCMTGFYHFADKTIMSTDLADGIGSSTHVNSVLDEPELMQYRPNLGVNGQVNSTHYWVKDPTNESNGYYIPLDSTYIELNQSRGQSYRHWYNYTDSTYTYSSDKMINQTNIIEGTDWITKSEYPQKFVIRLTNGSTYKLDTSTEVNLLISSIDNSTIWGVGYESFDGLMAFYLNFADTDWGHGQYLWYPRLQNGQLPAYNNPLYAFYLHLYAKLSGTWYNQIVNDRTLYSGQNPRNTIHFFNTSDTWGIYFITEDVSIMSSTWDFKHGFKYNYTDGLYHMINEFRCTDRDFEDIGWGYEITSSPTSDGTPYQPDRFVFTNETTMVTLNISQLWNVSSYLDNCYSQMTILSQNNESFNFTFDDMEQAGFTEQYLKLHNQTMPNGSIRKVLLAGMYGYGAYSEDTWITVDPSTGTLYVVDAEDLYWEGTTSYTGVATWRCGLAGDSDEMNAFLNFDTGISDSIHSITYSSSTLQTYVSTTTMESGDALKSRVYNIGGNHDSNSATESSTSYTLGTNSYDSDTTGFDSTGWKTWTTSTSVAYWCSNRGNTEDWISFKLEYSSLSAGDYIFCADAQSGSNEAKLSITYSFDNTAPSVSFQDDGNEVYAGLQEESVVVRYTDANGYNDIDDVYLYIGVGGTVWNMSLKWNVDTNTMTKTDPDGYLSYVDPSESTGGSATGGSGYFDITWKFTIDWDYSRDEEDIDYMGDCTDELSEDATNVTATGTGQGLETELVFSSVDFTSSAFPSGIEYGGGTTLDDGEWFKTGASFVVTGYVYYEGTSTAPPTTVFDPELKVDGVALGEDYDDDTLGSDGSFTIPTWTDTSSATDSDYDLELIISDTTGDFSFESNFDSGNSDDYYIDASVDATNPTIELDPTLIYENSSYLYDPNDFGMVLDYATLNGSWGTDGWSFEDDLDGWTGLDNMAVSSGTLLSRLAAGAEDQLYLDPYALSGATNIDSSLYRYAIISIYSNVSDVKFILQAYMDAGSKNIGSWHVLSTDIEVISIDLSVYSVWSGSCHSLRLTFDEDGGDGTLEGNEGIWIQSIRILSSDGLMDYAIDNGQWGYDGWSFIEESNDGWLAQASVFDVDDQENGYRYGSPTDDSRSYVYFYQDSLMVSTIIYRYCIIRAKMISSYSRSILLYLEGDYDVSFYTDFTASDTWQIFVFDLNGKTISDEWIRIYFDDAGDHSGNLDDDDEFYIDFIKLVHIPSSYSISASDFEDNYGYFSDQIAEDQEFWLKFYEGSGTTLHDSSPNGINGLSITEVSFDSNTWGSSYSLFSDYSMVCNDEDYCYVGQSSLWKSPELTISFWVNTGMITTNQGVFAVYLDSSNRYYLRYYYDLETSKNQWHGYAVIDGSSYNFPQSASNTATNNTWYMLTLSITANSWKFYIDGELVEESTSISDSLNEMVGTPYLYIGSSYYDKWNGSVDDFMFYSRVLTSREIEYLHSGMNNYHVGGFAYDIDNDIVSITDNSTIAKDPANIGSYTTWIFVYAFENGDSGSGNWTVVFTAYDLAGNSANVSFIFIEDNTAPSGYTDTLGRTTGVVDGYYVYNDGSDIYINTDYDDYFTEQLNDDGSDSQSGFWYAIIDYNSLLRTIYYSSSMPVSQWLYTHDKDDGYFVCRIYDRVGNYLEFNYTVTGDTVSPSCDLDYFTESSDFIYTSGSIVWYGDDMGSLEGLQIFIASTDSVSGIYAVEFPAWEGYSAWNDTASAYARTYNIANWWDETGVLTFYTWDHVGNSNSTTITVYRDTTNPSTSFDSLSENSIYLYWNGTHLFISDAMGTTVQYFTLNATGSDGGSNPSGMYAVMFLNASWGDNIAWNDTSSPYSQTFNVSSNEGSTTLYIKAVDNVGNWESTIEIIIIDEGSGANVELGIGIDTIDESSLYLYAPDNTTLWYGDDMSSAQTVTLNMIYTYNGSAGISHVNISIVWFSDSPSDSSAPYSLDLTIESTDTQTGTLYVQIWTNIGQMANDTLTVSRDTANPSGYSLAMASGYFYADITNDSTPLLTCSGASDSDSGISDGYYFEWGSDSYDSNSGFIASSTHSPTMSQTQNADFRVLVRDNVGNNGSFVYDEDNTIDLTPPSLSVTPSESSDYLYYPGSGTSIYYGSEMGSAQTFTFSGSSNDNYGLYLVNATPQFGETPFDYTPASYSFDYTIESSDNGDKTVRIIVYDEAGNRDVSSLYTFYEDNDAPTVSGITLDHSDVNDGTGYNPNDGYDDDLLAEYSLSDTPTDSGSGLPTSPYAYRWDEGGWTSWTSSTTYSPVVSDGDSARADIKVRDNVANEQYIYGESIVVDDDAPTGFSLTWGRELGWKPPSNYWYAYRPSPYTVLWINPNVNDYLNVTANNDGTIQNSGFWMVVWDGDSVLESQENDTDSLPSSKDFYYYGDSSGTFSIRIVNNAGNYQEFNCTVTPDGDNPTFTSVSLVSDTASIGYAPNTGYYDDSSVNVSATNDPSDGSGVGFYETCWRYTLDGSYDGGYEPYYSSHEISGVSDGSHTLGAFVTDLVGNNATVQTTNVIVDTDSPIGYTLSYTDADGIESGDYAYWNGTVMFGDHEESPTFYMIINDDGTIQNSGFWKTEVDEYTVYLASMNTTTDPLPHTQALVFDSSMSGDTMRVRIVNNAGNYQTIEWDSYSDITAPTGSFQRVEDSDALVAGYTNDSLLYVSISSFNDGTGSGQPTNSYAYNINGGAWESWTSSTMEDWSGLADQNHTLGIKLRDLVGNEQTYYTWYIVDTTDPVLGWLTLNESYAPNWYDQSVDNYAQATIYWTETNPFNITCWSSPYLEGQGNDTSPSGGVSSVIFKIQGASDGSYSLSVTIWDKAGNFDNSLLGTEAPINLEAGITATGVENWFYFYFFRADGIGLDWSDFNVSYVLDENYRNYTETKIRGTLYAQKYLNLTSSIRFIVRSYFGDVIHNQSYSLPSSFDLYITLNVYTLKVANLYDEIMNMTIERTGSSEAYDEQLMPYEIFSWVMYASTYNITTYIHGTTTIALDENGNSLDDFQVNLSSSDYALFVDAPLKFTELTNIFSEIWQINVVTNKDHRESSVVINIYLNGTKQGSGDFSSGIIILSRPQVGTYNLTVYATWSSYERSYYRQITVESNAEITSFVVSGVQSGSDTIVVSWNTNKGTGTLYVKDNGSLIATDSSEGIYKFDKSDTIGLHQLTFHIIVETMNFTYYADYTIAEWSVIAVVHLYDSATIYVDIEDYHICTITVTTSDERNFNGYIYINDTLHEVAIINGAGTFIVSSLAVAQNIYSVTRAYYTADGSNRSYVANDLTVTFDELIGHIELIQLSGNDIEIGVSFNNSYDDDFVNEFEYSIYLDNNDIGTRTSTTFMVENIQSGVHYITLKRIRSIDQEYVDSGRCNEISFEIPEGDVEIFYKTTVAPNIPIIGLIIIALVGGLIVRRRLRPKKVSWMEQDRQIEEEFNKKYRQ